MKTKSKEIPEKPRSPELIATWSAAHREPIIGALTLYLDFVNFFLYLPRALGENNDND